MKLHTNIIALCDYATISQDGKLSINGIFDELRTQQSPAVLSKAYLVATVSGTPNTSYRLTIKIERSSQQILPPLSMDMSTGTNGKNNLIIELAGAQFPEEGQYHFKVYDGEKEIGSTELKVIQLKNEVQTIKNIN